MADISQEANVPTAKLIARANHTGTQPINTIDGLTALGSTTTTSGSGNIVLSTSPTIVTPTLTTPTMTTPVLGVASATSVDMGQLILTDGITAPTATAGKAKIFVDIADGDLKVIFGDGTTKVLAADT